MKNILELKREWVDLLKNTAEALEVTPPIKLPDKLRTLSKRYDAEKHINILEELLILCLDKNIKFDFEKGNFNEFRFNNESIYNDFCLKTDCGFYCPFADYCRGKDCFSNDVIWDPEGAVKEADYWIADDYRRNR